MAGRPEIDADPSAAVEGNNRDLVLDLDRREPVAGDGRDGDVLHRTDDRTVHDNARPARLRQKDALAFDFDLLRVGITEAVVLALSGGTSESGRGPRRSS